MPPRRSGALPPGAALHRRQSPSRWLSGCVREMPGAPSPACRANVLKRVRSVVRRSVVSSLPISRGAAAVKTAAAATKTAPTAKTTAAAEASAATAVVQRLAQNAAQHDARGAAGPVAAALQPVRAAPRTEHGQHDEKAEEQQRQPEGQAARFHGRRRLLLGGRRELLLVQQGGNRANASDQA